MRSLFFMLVFTLFNLFFNSVYSSERVTPLVSAYEKIQNAVVSIETVKDGGHVPGSRVVSRSTGVIIDASGYLLTNYHPVQSGNDIRVKCTDGKIYSANMIGYDKLLDIAVLKIKGDVPFDYIALGSSEDLMVAEPVLAVGNIYGLENSVFTGIVSHKNRIIPVGAYQMIFLQTTAHLGTGSSGGPLVNVYGELVGINTAFYQDAFVGFAVPVDLIKRNLDSLIKKGFVAQGNFDIILKHDSGGFTIAETSGESLFLPGDKVLSLAEIQLNSRHDLVYIQTICPPGYEVPARILRNGHEIELPLICTD